MPIPFDDIAKYNRFSSEVRAVNDRSLKDDMAKFMGQLMNLTCTQAEREYLRLKERFDKLNKK